MKNNYNKYKTTIIESTKPKLEPKLIEIANLVSDSIIDKVLNMVSGSYVENIFK
jgi:hypothetical protein